MSLSGNVLNDGDCIPDTVGCMGGDPCGFKVSAFYNASSCPSPPTMNYGWGGVTGSYTGYILPYTEVTFQTGCGGTDYAWISFGHVGLSVTMTCGEPCG